jgi:tRNA dimethylallyltransferase
LEQAIELIKKRTRLFVKRQYTWFKKDKRIIWFNVLEFSLSQLRDLVYTTILRVWKEQGFNLKEGW